MNRIAKENRVDSYIQRPLRRYDLILKEMGDKEVTARSLAYAMGYQDLNAVRPRLTELERKGIIRICGKAYDTISKRNVSVYRRVEE